MNDDMNSFEADLDRRTPEEYAAEIAACRARQNEIRVEMDKLATKYPDQGFPRLGWHGLWRWSWVESAPDFPPEEWH